MFTIRGQGQSQVQTREVGLDVCMHSKLAWGFVSWVSGRQAVKSGMHARRAQLRSCHRVTITSNAYPDPGMPCRGCNHRP